MASVIFSILMLLMVLHFFCLSTIHGSTLHLWGPLERSKENLEVGGKNILSKSVKKWNIKGGHRLHTHQVVHAYTPCTPTHSPVMHSQPCAHARTTSLPYVHTNSCPLTHPAHLGTFST